jgi:hypothetical protein
LPKEWVGINLGHFSQTHPVTLVERNTVFGQFFNSVSVGKKVIFSMIYGLLSLSMSFECSALSHPSFQNETLAKLTHRKAGRRSCLSKSLNFWKKHVGFSDSV